MMYRCRLSINQINLYDPAPCIPWNPYWDDQSVKKASITTTSTLMAPSLFLLFLFWLDDWKVCGVWRLLTFLWGLLLGDFLPGLKRTTALQVDRWVNIVHTFYHHINGKPLGKVILIPELPLNDLLFDCLKWQKIHNFKREVPQYNTEGVSITHTHIVTELFLRGKCSF